MPRARVIRPVAPPAEDVPIGDTHMNGAESREADDLPPMADGFESLMQDLNGASQSKITVYRVNPTGPNVYVYQCTPEAFNLDDLRDKYGGGDFRLYIVRDHAFYRNLKVSIERKPVAPAAAPVPGEAAGVAELRAMLAKQADELREFRMRNSERGTGVGSIFQDLDLPATITAISAALVALRPPAPPPYVPPQENSADRAIDMLLKGIEIANGLKSDSGDGGGLMGVVRDLIKSPLLSQAVAASTMPPAPPAQPQAPRIPMPARQPNPAAEVSHAKPAAVAPADPNDVFAMIRPFVGKYLPVLVQKAKAESPSQLYAELILDSVPVEVIAPMLDAKNSAEIVNFLASVYPPVAEESPWFVSLVDEMRMLLEPEEDDALGQSDDPEAPVDAGLSP